jgi:hypothetical protein
MNSQRVKGLVIVRHSERVTDSMTLMATRTVILTLMAKEKRIRFLHLDSLTGLRTRRVKAKAKQTRKVRGSHLAKDSESVKWKD